VTLKILSGAGLLATNGARTPLAWSSFPTRTRRTRPVWTSSFRT